MMRQIYPEPLNLDPKILQSTNAMWNELRLNAPWSVGYVAYLIDQNVFESYEDWARYYFNSGHERKTLINSEWSVFKQDLEYQIPRPSDKLGKIDRTNIPNACLDLNYYFGRDEEDLLEKAAILIHHLPKLQLSLNEGLEIVKHRVLKETWNGIVVREQNCIVGLSQIFPHVNFVSSPAAFDHQYAIDFVAKIDDVPIFAIQIKPESYKANLPYIIKAQKANYLKHQSFYQKYGIRIFTLLASHSGEIINLSALERIKSLL